MLSYGHDRISVVNIPPLSPLPHPAAWLCYQYSVMDAGEVYRAPPIPIVCILEKGQSLYSAEYPARTPNRLTG